MRERLTELIRNAPTTDTVYGNIKLKTPIQTVQTIADYLLENGVIVPPVSVGQKVWYIKGGYYNSVHKKPCEIEVTEINQKWHGKILNWGFIANGTRYRFSSIGKTVFLTREAAEQALKGGEG